MIFAHDTEVALAAAAALVNTGARRRRRAATDRRRRSTRSSRTGAGPGRAPHDRAELDAVRALRPRLRAAVAASTRTTPSTSSTTLLREAQRAAPAGQARRVGLPPARDAAGRAAGRPDGGRGGDGVRRRRSASGELDRLRVCAADDCDDVLVDLSKNRSRRFCDTAAATGRTSPPTAPARPARSPARAGQGAGRARRPGLGDQRQRQHPGPDRRGEIGLRVGRRAVSHLHRPLDQRHGEHRGPASSFAVGARRCSHRPGTRCSVSTRNAARTSSPVSRAAWPKTIALR